jgi:hypothetical protein
MKLARKSHSSWDDQEDVSKDSGLKRGVEHTRKGLDQPYNELEGSNESMAFLCSAEDSVWYR